jgi:hypothetical protein
MKKKVSKRKPTKRTKRRPDVVDDVMLAYLSNQGLQNTLAYLKRGRPLSNESTESLKEHWVACFKRWAANWQDKTNEPLRDDIEAELGLRKQEPPYKAVKKEKDALIAAAERAYDILKSNPDRLAEVESDLKRDLIEFIHEAPAKKN